MNQFIDFLQNDTIDNLLDNLSKYSAGNDVNKAIHTIEGDSSKCDKDGSDDINLKIFDNAIRDDETEISSIEVESDDIKTADLKFQEEINIDTIMQDDSTKDVSHEDNAGKAEVPGGHGQQWAGSPGGVRPSSQRNQIGAGRHGHARDGRRGTVPGA